VGVVLRLKTAVVVVLKKWWPETSRLLGLRGVEGD
jgi:hypothetical protein